MIETLVRGITILLELLGLGVTVWLGLALVALAPRRPASWLAALLFWSFSLVFALTLFQFGRPLTEERPWLPYEVLRWVLIPLPLAWLGLMQGLLPARVRPLLRPLRQLGVFLALLLVFVAGVTGPWAPPERLRWQWLFYPLYIGTALVMVGPAILIALRSTRLTRVPARRDSARALALASILALLATAYRVGGFWVWPDIPPLPGDLLLLVAIVSLGGALVLRRVAEGETNAPAFIYSLTNAAAITLLYALLAGGAAALLGLSWTLLIAVIPLAVATHWLTDWSRSLFDAMFYRAPVQRLRADLRALIRTLDRDEALGPQLQPVLARLAAQSQAALVAVALPEEGAMRVVASHPPLPEGQEVGWQHDISRYHPGSHWEIPLVGAEGPLGTLLAWSSPTRGFSDLDLALLDEVGAQLATLLAAWQAQGERLEEIERLVSTYREQAATLEQQVQTLALGEEEGSDLATLEASAREWVEEALRNLHNVAYLGQHPLAQLQVVQARVDAREDGVATHLERGQAVRQLCEELIERLRPGGAVPREPLPAEWRLYTVLHAAYVEGEPNREIMSRLYIGQGTFHRARRQALGSLAEALVELERAALT